jgi:glutathione S-transferase
MAVSMYASPSSPFSARVRLVASLTGVDITEKPMPGALGSAERKAISFFGKIPALQVDGHTLIESAALMEYLVDISSGSALMPAAPFERARVRGAIAAHDNWVLTAAWPMFLSFRSGSPNPAVIGAALDDVAQQYDTLADLFESDGLVLGGALTIADLAIAPFGVLFRRLCPMFGKVSPFEANPRLAAWWAAVRAADGVTPVLDAMDEAFAAAFIRK